MTLYHVRFLGPFLETISEAYKKCLIVATCLAVIGAQRFGILPGGLPKINS